MPKDISVQSSELEKIKAELRFKDEILKNLAEGIYLIKATDGTIVYANPKFESMFGYKSGELIGKNVSIVNAPTKKSPEQTAKEIMKILEEKGEWHGEVENIKKDGTKFWCFANVSVFNHPEYGKVLVSVHTDITDRKKAEEALRQQSESLEKMNDLLVGRELKMIELKERIRQLEQGSSAINKTSLTWKEKFKEGEDIEEIFVTKIKGPYFAEIDKSKLSELAKTEIKKMLQVLIDDSTRHLELFRQMEVENG